MSAFARELAARSKRRHSRGRRWVFVPYDQLTSEIGPLAKLSPRDAGIVLVECPAKAARRPYHKQKLALVIGNLRHFAIEQASRGVAVRHHVSRGTYADALREVVGEIGPLTMMRAAERELRVELEPLVREGAIEVVPHEGWLTTSDDFNESHGGPPWRMDAFYRHVRRQTGILMDHGKPVGGRLSFDVDNRQAWHGEPDAPSPPRFRSSPIKDEVLALVRERYARHPGTLRGDTLPVTQRDAERSWAFALDACLPSFGPFEDAMSTASRSLFHTRVSPLLNNHRLLPARVIRDVVARERLPLGSREGFVRQVLGWREFVRHVHEATDGFRRIGGERAPVARRAGDGGYARWAKKPWPTTAAGLGGSLASALDATGSVPPAYWGERSGLRCLDTVVEAVWDEGYSHHITRLMVLSNIAALLDVSPRELTDWFWVAYVDAYDWVVEPNVHGMGTFGLGPLFTTKPYVSGAAYVDRMSDYCGGCRFDPKTTCPLGPMYWAYLERHREVLAAVPRMRLPLVAAARRSAAQKRADRDVFEATRDALARGHELG